MSYPGYAAAGNSDTSYVLIAGSSRLTPYTVAVHAGDGPGTGLNTIPTLYIGGAPAYTSSTVNGHGPGVLSVDGGTVATQGLELGYYYGGTVSQSGGLVLGGGFVALGYGPLPIGQNAEYDISGGTFCRPDLNRSRHPLGARVD